MSRPLRLEYPGALYHVTTRGNAQADIFIGDADREKFLLLLKDEVIQQGWICYAWCLMDNHYHFLIETPEANLVRGMQRLNGRYTQCFNRSHGRVGHIFQGRYKAILVEKEAHLLELCRYIVLNPVRAGMVDDVRQWRWSSYNDMQSNQGLSWLAIDRVLELFSMSRGKAIQCYHAFVADKMGATRPWDQLRGQLYLGGDQFLAETKNRLLNRYIDADIPTTQRNPERPTSDQLLKDVAGAYGIAVDDLFDRQQYHEPYQTTVFLLRRVCNLSLKDVAAMAGISPGRVSQIQKEVSGKDLPKSLGVYKV